MLQVVSGIMTLLHSFIRVFISILLLRTKMVMLLPYFYTYTTSRHNVWTLCLLDT